MIIQGIFDKKIEFNHITSLCASVASAGSYDYTPDLPTSPVYLIYLPTYDTYYQWHLGFNTTEISSGTSNIITLGFLENPLKISWINVYSSLSSATTICIVIGWN